MILLIDSGNTCIKLGYFIKKLNLNFSLSNNLFIFYKKDLEFIYNWLKKIVFFIDFIVGINVSNKSQQIKIDKLFQKLGVFINWQLTGKKIYRLVNNYKITKNLGSDRFFALLSILSKIKILHYPILLATFGTATTIDLISPDDIFIGGLIIPGINMMHYSLKKKIDNLNFLKKIFNNLYSKNSNESICNGIFNSQIGSLILQIFYVRKKWSCVPNIYVSGGNLSRIKNENIKTFLKLSLCKKKKYIINFIGYPVLEGLHYISKIIFYDD